MIKIEMKWINFRRSSYSMILDGFWAFWTETGADFDSVISYTNVVKI